MRRWISSTNQQSGNVILEFALTLPFLLLIAQGMFYLTRVLLDAQRATQLTREAGYLANQDCASRSDSTSMGACLANLQSQLINIAASKLSLDGQPQSAAVSVPLTYPNPNNTTQTLVSQLTPPSARTRGVHYLVVACATFACIDQGGDDCDQSDTACSCSCGETLGNPNLPAIGLQFTDPEDPQWQGPGTDPAGRLIRVRIWQALRDLLRRKGRAIISTTQREYLTPPAMVANIGAINESAAF